MHTLVIADNSYGSSNAKYRLSSFGVMLTIALVRYHYMGIDNHRFPKYDRPSLYYNKLSLSQYIDRIAE